MRVFIIIFSLLFLTSCYSKIKYAGSETETEYGVFDKKKKAVYKEGKETNSEEILYPESCFIPELPSLIGCYPFNGSIEDESGNERHFIANNITFGVDSYGNKNRACTFTEKNCSLVLNLETNDILIENLTLTCKIHIHLRKESGVLFAFGHKVYISLESNVLYFNEGEKKEKLLELPIDTWYNVIITKEKNNGFIQIGEKEVHFTWSQKIGQKIHIGQFNQRSSFIGKIDEIKIFNTSLTREDINILKTLTK